MGTLTKSFMKNLKTYLGDNPQSGVFSSKEYLFATNGVSLIIFDEAIQPTDFTGMEIKDGEKLIESIGKYILDPYMKRFEESYESLGELYLSDIDEENKGVHAELGIPLKEKMYTFKDRNLNISSYFHGMYFAADLLYDVAKVIGTEKGVLKLWIPYNKTIPAVMIGENRNGIHYGFILGTGRNRSAS